MGANLDDQESPRPYIESLVVREFSQVSSNWRSAETAQLYLNRNKIPVIWDIDTRALVRHLRLHGALRGMVSTDGTPSDQLIFEAKQLPSMAGQELASRVSTAKTYKWDTGSIDFVSSPWTEQMGESGAGGEGRKLRVVAYDYGIKQNILRLLVDHQCEVAVVPAKTSAEEVLAMGADGVFLSNGPGDPEPATYAIENIRKMMGKVPVFGICLGHQLCGLALGGKTFKLKFGHHGANLSGGRICLRSRLSITSQESCRLCVDPESLPSSDVEITHLNLNDHTNEGLRGISRCRCSACSIIRKLRPGRTIRTTCSRSSRI